MEIFGIPDPGLSRASSCWAWSTASFYAMLSLGLAVIFGLLDIVNFAHGALYMMGAFVAWIMLDKFGVNYWFALVLAPLVVGVLGVVIETLLLKHLYKLDPLYGLLLTFGLSLIARRRVPRAVTASRASPIRCPNCCRAPPTSAS